MYWVLLQTGEEKRYSRLSHNHRVWHMRKVCCCVPIDGRLVAPPIELPEPHDCLQRCGQWLGFNMCCSIIVESTLSRTFSNVAVQNHPAGNHIVREAPHVSRWSMLCLGHISGTIYSKQHAFIRKLSVTIDMVDRNCVPWWRPRARIVARGWGKEHGSEAWLVEEVGRCCSRLL